MSVVPRRRLAFGSRLDRYVAGQFLSSYAAALGLLVGLFLLLDLAANADKWFEPWPDGTTASGSTIALYVVYNLPYIFLQISPFVTLLAAMFTMNRMLKKNEVSAALSAGIGVHRLLLPIYVAGIAAAAGMFAVREGIALGIADRRDALRDELQEKRHERVIESIVVHDLSGSLVILENFHPDPVGGDLPSMEGLTAHLRVDNRYLSVRAAKAWWEDGLLHLEDGRRTALVESEDATVTEIDVLEGFSLAPGIALTYHRAQVNPLELSFSEVQELMRREPSHPAWQTLWHYHLTFPLANLVLLLVGLPLMFTYERGGGAERMALGGLLCVFYFGIDFVLRSLGLGGGLDPALASWLPVLLFGSLGVVLTDAIRT